MKKYGVIGIDLQRLKGEFGTQALKFSGNNFGNMLFTSAVYNQIPNCFHVGFNFDPVKVRYEYDGLVIPAANWINVKQDWGFLADLLEEANIPVCVVGLGSQINSEEDFRAIPEGTKRLLQVISRLSVKVGVRGEYTQSVVERLGVQNSVSLGCPSIFLKNEVPSVRPLPNAGDIRVGVGPTRYVLPNKAGKVPDEKQRDLYRYALQNASSIYYQSEQFEIACMNRESVSEHMDSALSYYGVDDEHFLVDGIMRRGKYHKDIDQWIADSRKDDLYIGTRIHGAVASVLAGTPAILITHDNRTDELAKSMGIPSKPIKELAIGDLSRVSDFAKNFNFRALESHLSHHIGAFRSFYSQNDIESVLPVSR